MWNVIAADAWTSESLWAWYCARRAMEQAVAALRGAESMLLALVDASHWNAKGVLALHALLDAERERTAELGDRLENARWQIEGLAG